MSIFLSDCIRKYLHNVKGYFPSTNLAFLLYYSTELTIQISSILRLLNNLSVDWIGMALTWKQFESLGPSTLLDRLLARKHYPLAVELVRIFQKLPSKVPEYMQVIGAIEKAFCYLPLFNFQNPYHSCIIESPAEILFFG